jgi:hypothetical protein
MNATLNFLLSMKNNRYQTRIKIDSLMLDYLTTSKSEIKSDLIVNKSFVFFIKKAKFLLTLLLLIHFNCLNDLSATTENKLSDCLSRCILFKSFFCLNSSHLASRWFTVNIYKKIKFRKKSSDPLVPCSKNKLTIQANKRPNIWIQDWFDG